MSEFWATLQKTLGAVSAAAIVGFVMKLYLSWQRKKQDAEAIKRKVESDKKTIHDRINNMSDDELSESSKSIYDRIGRS